MSEVKDIQANGTQIRLLLLSSVSAAALVCSGQSHALASDNDHPTVWVELDGQWAEQLQNTSSYEPLFVRTSKFDVASDLALQKQASSVWDEGGKLLFQPWEDGWQFLVSARYGKSSRDKSKNQRTSHVSSGGFQAFYNAYQNVDTISSENHLILDFRVGKDVGLGLLGRRGISVLSAGLRYAQFSSRNSVTIQSQPTNSVQYYHRFYASFAAKRKFTGLGPSLSWESSVDLIGNQKEGTLSVDWGVNGAVLFGRQKTQTHHQTTQVAIPYSQTVASYRAFHPRIPVYHHFASIPRNRSLIVPDVGGFAGISWRYPNAKVSFGYRADFFIGAMDSGIDVRRNADVGFHGPFAAISVGLGG